MRSQTLRSKMLFCEQLPVEEACASPRCRLLGAMHAALRCREPGLQGRQGSQAPPPAPGLPAACYRLVFTLPAGLSSAAFAPQALPEGCEQSAAPLPPSSSSTPPPAAPREPQAAADGVCRLVVLPPPRPKHTHRGDRAGWVGAGGGVGKTTCWGGVVQGGLLLLPSLQLPAGLHAWDAPASVSWPEPNRGRTAC